MDKKKLIGTIIGVTMFAALIAGATYAWLTGTVTITNGTYNSKTLNFVIDYTKGTDITTAPMLGSATGPATSKLVVAAQGSSSNSSGTFSIYLVTTSSNALTTSGAVHYAVCSGSSTSSSCTGALTAGSTGVLGTPGSVTGAGTITIYTDNTTPTNTTKTYYWVHIWMDGATIQNSHKGQSYAGYIKADAKQTVK